MRELQAVRDFVGSPENILGRAATKHGEIAERVHVGVSRAWDVLHRRAPIATTDGVPRTGPVDYRVDGVDIQSKYYNGLRNTLDGVASHAEKYPGFPDGPGRYHIPRDQHRQFDEFLRTGGIEGQSDRSASALQRRVDDLERTTGRPADDLIEPGDASYAEVQRGRVHDTLRNREDGLARANEKLERAARVEHGTSLAGFVKAAGLGGMVGGGVGLAQAVWIKYREGRNPFRGEFSIHDWQDVGVVAAQGAGGGAVAGSSLYLLTNSTALAALFAGSLISGLMGIGVLLRDPLRRNDRRRAVCGDVAHHRHGRRGRGVGVRGWPDHDPRSAAWRALLGGLAGKLVTSALKDGLRESESALLSSLAEYERYAFGQLDEEFRAVTPTIGRLVRKPGTLGCDRLRPRGEQRALESQRPDGEDCRRARRADSPHDRRSRHLHAEVTMDALHNPLDGLSPALYVAIHSPAVVPGSLWVVEWGDTYDHSLAGRLRPDSRPDLDGGARLRRTHLENLRSVSAGARRATRRGGRATLA